MQVKDFLLCADCEERFSKYERWAAGQVYDGRDFPLLLRLTLALPFLETPRLRGVSGVAAGIDTEKLAYFGLSILWRGAAHKWKMPGGQTTSINLGSYEDRIRTFLLGETGLPGDIIVVATACTDWLSQGTFYTPCLFAAIRSRRMLSLHGGLALRCWWEVTYRRVCRNSAVLLQVGSRFSRRTTERNQFIRSFTYTVRPLHLERAWISSGR
jgi:hypothetical protein